jgi:hypothetical protein
MNSGIFPLEASLSQGLEASVGSSFPWHICQVLLEPGARPKETKTAGTRCAAGHGMLWCKELMCFNSMQSQALRRVKLSTTWTSMYFSTYWDICLSQNWSEFCASLLQHGDEETMEFVGVRHHVLLCESHTPTSA